MTQNDIYPYINRLEEDIKQLKGCDSGWFNVSLDKRLRHVNALAEVIVADAKALQAVIKSLCLK